MATEGVELAGDWVKMRSNLWDDPRVSCICDAIDVSEAAVVGGLFRLWTIADQHSESGELPAMTAAALDRKCGLPGFADAMQSVGWLTVTADGLQVPRFGEHNGESAKKRAEDAKRKAAVRKKSDKCPQNDGQKADKKRRNAELEKEKEKEKEKELKKEEGPEQAAGKPPGNSAVDFGYLVKGSGEPWYLSGAQQQSWNWTFPELSVAAELTKARAWLVANPRKRKTRAGMPAFLLNWLKRADADRSAGRGSGHLDGLREFAEASE